CPADGSGSAATDLTASGREMTGSPEASGGAQGEVPAPPRALRPSEYTAALIQAVRVRHAWVCGRHALELGSGSGVVLAAMGALGAASLCGVDIESEAVAHSKLLLDHLGHCAIAELYQGDMWLPVSGRRFDLIVANLPHFPMEPHEFGGRLPTWSSGGTNG